MIENVPHIMIPAMLFNIIICSLFTMLSWQITSAVLAFRKRRSDR
jgi:hypothetical protein